MNLQDLVLEGYRKGNRFGELLGMDFKVHDKGQIEYTMTITEQHLATIQTAHGGVLAAFADATLGVGALSVSSVRGNVVSTVEFKISYFAPVKLHDQLTGKTVLLKEGKSIIYMEAEFFNQNDVLVGKASGTFNAYPAEKALRIIE